jgi:hypothetical protein
MGSIGQVVPAQAVQQQRLLLQHAKAVTAQIAYRIVRALILVSTTHMWFLRLLPMIAFLAPAPNASSAFQQMLAIAIPA